MLTTALHFDLMLECSFFTFLVFSFTVITFPFINHSLYPLLHVLIVVSKYSELKKHLHGSIFNKITANHLLILLDMFSWILKVPKYLQERWERNKGSQTEVGKMRITRSRLLGYSDSMNELLYVYLKFNIDLLMIKTRCGISIRLCIYAL